MSYFAKPNFIVYDEWFVEDLEKNKLNFKHKKTKPISNIHEFYYEKSNYKVGGSENNLQLETQVNEKELITNNYPEKLSEKLSQGRYKKFSFMNKFSKSKLKFNNTKNLIYSLSIVSSLLIFGFMMFFISSPKKSESNEFINLGKEF